MSIAKLMEIIARGSKLAPKPSKEQAIEELLATRSKTQEILAPRADAARRVIAARHAGGLETLLRDLERPVNTRKAMEAYDAGFTLPAMRLVRGGDPARRSNFNRTPGMHAAAPGNEYQLEEIFDHHVDRASAAREGSLRQLRTGDFELHARPLLLRSETAVDIPDGALAGPEALARYTGLPMKNYDSDNEHFAATALTDLLSRYGVDIAAYRNTGEKGAPAGASRLSYATFPRDAAQGFSRGGLAQMRACACGRK